MTTKGLSIPSQINHAFSETNSVQPIVNEMLDDVATSIQAAKEMQSPDNIKLFY